MALTSGNISAVRTGSGSLARWVLTCAAASVLVTATPSFGQWTQYGGPGQDFKANARGLAAKWPEDGPKQVWQRELGDGYSGVLVDGDLLYTMYRGDNQEIVIALDAATGKTVWEHKYDAEPDEGHAHQFGDGPRSTPLLDGDRLYTIGVSGTMHCLNKGDGKVYWKHELWKDMGGNVQNHGYSSSPIAYKDTIITLVGGDGASVVAFDKGTGDVVWKQHSFKNSYSTPRVWKIRGRDHLITFMANEVIGLDPNNGNLFWRYAHENQWEQNVCMPVWDGDSGVLLISSPEAGARGLKLKPKGATFNVEEVWSTRKIQFYHTNTVRLGDYVYGSTGTMAPAFMAAVNLETGKIAWRKRGFKKATCVYADGRFVILDEEGNLALATAAPDEFNVISKTTVLEEPAWTVPTLVGKRLYLRDKTQIKALDLG